MPGIQHYLSQEWEALGSGQYIVYFFALLVLFVIGVVLLGQFVAGAQHYGQAYAVVNRTVDEVWEMVHDVSKLHMSGDQMRAMQVPDQPGEELKEWREDMGSSVITVRVVSQDKGSSDTDMRIVERVMTDSEVPMTAQVTIRMYPVEEGAKTLVHMFQNIEVRNGTWHVPLFRFVLWMGGKDAGMRQYLERMLKLCKGEGLMLDPKDLPTDKEVLESLAKEEKGE